MIMKDIKRLISAILLIFMLISLYACASGGSAETTSPPPVAPTQNESPNVSPETSPDGSPDSLPGVSPDTSSDTSPLPPQEPGDNDSSSAPDTVTGEIVITFDYVRQSGSASNQFAIWIEDMDGNYINTVYATKWTANGGYVSRPDSIAMWVEKSGIATMPDYYVDAISGATPGKSASQSFTWNLRDINGETVSPGEYRVFLEGTLRWKNRVIYSCVIGIGNTPATVQADAEYIYEASDRQAALTVGSPENAMIGTVTVSFIC